MKFLLAFFFAATLSAQLRAGVARTRITPPTPAWLVGFAARTQPASEIGLDLFAKALAISSGPQRAVIVTADIIGFTERTTNEIVRRAAAKHGLRRDQLFFFASHTHSGPALYDRMLISVADSPEFHRATESYTTFFIDQIEAIIDQSLAKLTPVKLSSGWTSAPFAFNRRTEQLAQIRPGETHPAPTDHRVPVLRLTTEFGQPLAILFGYACHPTVLTGNTYEISGDYPGYAQQMIEATVPGVTAMFVLLTAGDQRATPRGTRELARQHGTTLATAVLKATLTPLAPTLKTTLEEIRLPFASHTREAYLAESTSTDPFAVRRGKAMLAAMESKQMPLAAPYPVQALRLGALTLLALPGEVVVDYALHFQRKYGNTVITAGYASYLPGYIPSTRIQREGGYEAGDSMMYFLQPGWFTDQVEPLVLKAADKVLQRLATQSK
jgi:neutral ceramidase